MKVAKFEAGCELSGYISGMDDQYYHSTPGFISKSSLSVLKDSPFKFFNQKKHEPTKAMQIGTAIHCAILEPEKFKRNYMLESEIKSKASKAYKDLVAKNEGVEILTGADAVNLVGMRKAIYSNDTARELLGLEGWCEVSGFHVDPETGISLRHRFDKLTSCGIGIDLKKTQSVNPDELSKTIFKYGYDMQDALYSDAYEAITGQRIKAFYFVFVEEKYPHQVAVVELDDISKQVGRDNYKKLLVDYSYYLDNPDKANNNAPAQMISLPEWVLRQYENELEEGGIF